MTCFSLLETAYIFGPNLVTMRPRFPSHLVIDKKASLCSYTKSNDIHVTAFRFTSTMFGSKRFEAIGN